MSTPIENVKEAEKRQDVFHRLQVSARYPVLMLAQVVNRSATIGTLTRHRLVRGLALLTGVFVLVLLGTYNQPYYPGTWLDEGFVLQGPMNLVRYGQYAMKSAEGFRVLDQPLIANGPGIVLPISAAFALFGTGLLQARLVVAVYLVLTAMAFFTLAKRLYGTSAAMISIFLLLAFPQEGFLKYGRYALGNVPALGYFLFGYLLWMTSWERGRWGYALGGGVMFGLAMVTKGQYGLLIPMLLVVAVVDWVYYRTIGVKRIALALLIALTCMGIWWGVQRVVVGPENFAQHLAAIRSSSRVTVFAFRPMRIPRNAWYLIRSGMPLFVAPGLIYAAWACRKPGPHCSRQLPLVVMVVIWLAWYVFASVGWPRYAFEAYAVGTLLAGKFVVDMVRFLPSDRSASNRTGQSWVFLRAGALLVAAAVLLGGIWGLTRQVSRIVERPDKSAQLFAEYLQNNVGLQAVVESWDWQIDVLADLNYHHPPNAWVDSTTAVINFGEAPAVDYDPFEHRPDYLIDGPWSKSVGVYAPYLASGCCHLVFSAGAYDLYEVKVKER